MNYPDCISCGQPCNDQNTFVRRTVAHYWRKGLKHGYTAIMRYCECGAIVLDRDLILANKAARERKRRTFHLRFKEFDPDGNLLPEEYYPRHPMYQEALSR